MSLTLAQLQAIESTNPAAQAAGLAQGLVDMQTNADAAVAGTVPAGSISMAEIADIATKTVIGRTAAGTGVPSAIAIATTLKADLSLDNVDNTSNATERAATATLTNKTLTSPVIASIASDLSVVGTVESADATTPILSTASGKTNTGYLSLAGKTSGSFKILPADATAQIVTMGVAAQTVGDSTLTIPDQAGVSSDVVTTTLAQTLASKTLTTATIGAASYVNDGAIAITSSVARLTKAGVGAYTLAAPGAGDEGLILTIISQSDNAHVVTATNLIDDGVTGGAKDTATFAAFTGASITLMAINQKWAVIANNNVTVAGS